MIGGGGDAVPRRIIDLFPEILDTQRVGESGPC